MWIIYQLDRASAAYSVPYVQRLRGVLVMSTLISAVKAAALRHEVLRTKYGNSTDGHSRQWVMDIDDWILPVREEFVEDEEKAEAIVHEEVTTAIELESSSVRLTVVHVNQNEHIVVLNVHHIATDAVSENMVVQLDDDT